LTSVDLKATWNEVNNQNEEIQTEQITPDSVCGVGYACT